MAKVCGNSAKPQAPWQQNRIWLLHLNLLAPRFWVAVRKWRRGAEGSGERRWGGSGWKEGVAGGKREGEEEWGEVVVGVECCRSKGRGEKGPERVAAGATVLWGC